MFDVLNYINGSLVPAARQNWLDNIEPATGQVYSRVPASDAADVENAVAAARAAFPIWRNKSLDERAHWLARIADKIAAASERFIQAESQDSGKPVAVAAEIDIPRAVHNFRFFSQATTQWASESHAMPGLAINYTLRDPIGVVGCISPWNLPLYLFSWKIAPALAAGNCVVAKPSELTPLTAGMLGEICQELGLPAGVLNIVHGLGPVAGQAIVEHPRVRAISFTGSTKVGAEIARIAAPEFKKLSLELGGKNASIVFADADFETAVEQVARAAFKNQGQICLCGSRIFVQKSIYPAFRAALSERVDKLRLGDPKLPETEQGALVSEQHLAKVLSYIELAQREGGRILTGGSRVELAGRCTAGYFVAPTLIENLPPEARVNQDEIFGPVATLMPFETEEEVLGHANASRYGLSTSIWTSDLKRAHRMAAQVEVGIVWINCWLLRDLRTPFGGSKHSGVGREGGVEALRFFTEAKNVCVKL